jgi:hypothetical protein
MNKEATDIMNDMAPQALAELKHYFQTTDESAGKRADVALKLLGRINGNDSNRLKLLALQFQVARQMGMKGEPLRPLLAELNPAFSSGQAQAPAISPGTAGEVKSTT